MSWRPLGRLRAILEVSSAVLEVPGSGFEASWRRPGGGRGVGGTRNSGPLMSSLKGDMGGISEKVVE